MLLTNSAVQTYNLCARRWYWRYCRGIAPVEVPYYLTIGRLFHQGISAFYNGGLDAAMEALNPAEQADTDPEDVLTARFMVVRYAEFAELNPLPGEFLESELAIKLRTGEDLQLGGVVDGLARTEEGFWIIEFKTAGSIDWNYLERVGLDGQITHYMLLAEPYIGEVPKGVLYVVVSRPRKYRRKGESIQSYLKRNIGKYQAEKLTHFAHQKAFRNDRLLTEKWEELHRTYIRILNSIEAGVWCKNDGVCFLRERRCPYIPLCLHGERPDTLAGFASTPAHEELTEIGSRQIEIDLTEGTASALLPGVDGVHHHLF